MSNIATVKSIYESFGRGDVPAILEKLDDNVAWEAQSPVPEVPWLQERHGKANVPGFFDALAPLTFNKFDPHTFFESGNKVFVLVGLDTTTKGKNYVFPNVGHLWEFNTAGKVTKYDHISDTAQMIRAARGE